MARPRCYLVVGHAPESVTLKEANDLWNAYIADKKRGHCVYHDHFSNQPGGVAIFVVSTDQQKTLVEEAFSLPNWNLDIYPLIYAQSAAGFIYQTDYTTTNYGGVPLTDLLERVNQARINGTDPKQA